MTYEKILSECKKLGIKFVDLKFCDLFGAWQHFSIPIREFSKETILEGIGFDGSSIRGCKNIEKSDMVLFSDLNTFCIDCFGKEPAASFICDMHEFDNKRYECDPRYVAKKAEEYLLSLGIADKAYLGPEAEFFIFDRVSFNSGQNFSHYEIQSEEAFWDRRDANTFGLHNDCKIRNKEGYFPVSPQDSLSDIRREMVTELEKCNIAVEKEHHEVAAGGQAEIDIKYDSLLRVADKIMMFKHVIKNVAHRNGKTATFMPKPIFGDNGSGMHVHISLWKDGVNLFYNKNGYAGLSKVALYFIGGLLRHAPSLMAFVAPTTNSYKRLVPGYEAPVNLVYSACNRSTAVRVPMHNCSGKAKRIEFRPPDPSANPYLAFSAILMAGLDGIENKIDPGEPFDKNVYKVSDEENKKISKAPDSLDAALLALENDYKFLMKGNVFTEQLLKSWILNKKELECKYLSIRPNPLEFFLYYNT